MTELKLKVLDKNQSTKVSGDTGVELAVLAHTAVYEEGDMICLEVDKPGCLVEVQLDDAMRPAVLFLQHNVLYYKVPFGELRTAISPKAFSGNSHVLTARVLDDAEAGVRRNLALNPYDGFAAPAVFPHADANVETRDEAVFAARNAIDGIYANNSHGMFPYGSWGINKRDDAEWKLDFGREVAVDEIRITLRADFPHDNYWSTCTVQFSDGSRESLELAKTASPQCFSIQSRKITELTLKDLIKGNGNSPFPALTQFEAWGTWSVG